MDISFFNQPVFFLAFLKLANFYDLGIDQSQLSSRGDNISYFSEKKSIFGAKKLFL